MCDHNDHQHHMDRFCGRRVWTNRLGRVGGLVVTDLDGDGHLDIGTTAGSSTEPAGQTVAVARGVGDGTFMPFSSYLAGTEAVALAAGDFTGDGRPDLIAVDYDADTATLLPATAGGYVEPANWAVQDLRAAAIADVNGDGRLDVVASDGQVLAGLTGGGLASPTMAAGSDGFSVTLPDWMGDGVPDLVCGGPDHGLTVNPGLGDGTFGSMTALAPSLENVLVASGDFDDDGHADLALLDVAPSKLTVLYGDGQGAVAATITADVGLEYALGVVTADFDR